MVHSLEPTLVPTSAPRPVGDIHSGSRHNSETSPLQLPPRVLRLSFVPGGTLIPLDSFSAAKPTDREQPRGSRDHDGYIAERAPTPRLYNWRFSSRRGFRRRRSPWAEFPLAVLLLVRERTVVGQAGTQEGAHTCLSGTFSPLNFLPFAGRELRCRRLARHGPMATAPLTLSPTTTSDIRNGRQSNQECDFILCRMPQRTCQAAGTEWPVLYKRPILNR